MFNSLTINGLRIELIRLHIKPTPMCAHYICMYKHSNIQYDL